LLGLTPAEYKECEIFDLIDMYDAYRWSIMNNNENYIQAQLNYSLNVIAHLISQMNAKNPKPFKGKVEDYMYKPRVSARKEAEEIINAYTRTTS
jgi:hypothetical protein